MSAAASAPHDETMTLNGTAGGYVHPSPSTQLVAAMRAELDGRPFDLTSSYELCRRINAAHGRTYYFATRLLPAHKRPHVHALYAFARYADDLVDHMALEWDGPRRRAALEEWSQAFMTDLERGVTDDPVAMAVIHTVRSLGVDLSELRAFLRSMAMDLTVTTYETYDDLYEYMYGSAAVIGSMMLPILEPTSPAARRPAMDLGVAFQLTNFIRDVAEDHARGRIYLPMADLRRFGVTDEDFRHRRVTPAMRRMLGFQIARTRAIYQRARAGWSMLPPASRRCVRTAHHLYEGILDAVEAADYQVFDVRASVPGWRKAGVALAQMGTLSLTPAADAPMSKPTPTTDPNPPVPAVPTPRPEPTSLEGSDGIPDGRNAPVPQPNASVGARTS